MSAGVTDLGDGAAVGMRMVVVAGLVYCCMIMICIEHDMDMNMYGDVV